MKNILAILSAGLLLSTALFITGCKKEDETPPKLTMNGANPIMIFLNQPFIDPGVTSLDNEDGAISVTSNVSATNPNINQTGTYYIDYSVSDAAGNEAETRRTVIVSNQADSLSGAYAVTGNCATGWIDGIIPSTTVNNRITFTQFGRYTNANGKLSADIDTSLTVTIVTATIFCGTIPTNKTFSGGGAITFSGDTLWINVTATDSLGTTNCSYTYIKQ